MDFKLEDSRISVSEIARRIGYIIIDNNGLGEHNLVKKIHFDNFPRFHIYLKQQGEVFLFSLHLDQKKPSYGSSHAHNGEYFGPVVEAEADRIQEVLDQEDRI